MSNRIFAAGNQSHKPHRLTRGLGDLPGIPATGQRFSLVCGSIILELESGKIRRESDYWDAATFMKQVGVLPLQMSDVFSTHLYHSHLYYMYTQAVRLGPWVNREVGHFKTDRCQKGIKRRSLTAQNRRNRELLARINTNADASSMVWPRALTRAIQSSKAWSV